MIDDRSAVAPANRRQFLAGAGTMAALATARPSAAEAEAYRPAAIYRAQDVGARPGVTIGSPPTGMERLRLGVTSNPRTWPLIDRQVRLAGLDAEVTTGQPGELFFRQLRDGAFDASEMSLSFLMIASLAGDRRFVPLPVFTTRSFFHTLTLVRRGAGIRHPSDLKGKRVGVPDYMMSGALWTRGILKDEFGVRPEDIEWHVEKLPGANQGKLIGKAIPANVTVHQIGGETDVGQMMLAGRLDAAVMYIWGERPTPDARSTINLYDSPQVTTLFPDPVAENIRYHAKTNVFPINHCVVVKRTLAEQFPTAVDYVTRVFAGASDLSDAIRAEMIEYHENIGRIDARSSAGLKVTATPYGYAPNRETLRTLARYSFEQGLTPTLVDMDRFFTFSP